MNPTAAGLLLVVVVVVWGAELPAKTSPAGLQTMSKSELIRHIEITQARHEVTQARHEAVQVQHEAELHAQQLQIERLTKLLRNSVRPTVTKEAINEAMRSAVVSPQGPTGPERQSDAKSRPKRDRLMARAKHVLRNIPGQQLGESQGLGGIEGLLSQCVDTLKAKYQTPCTTEMVHAHRAMQGTVQSAQREDMTLMDWSTSVFDPATNKIPFFTPVRSALFNKMWSAAFSIPDAELTGYIKTLQGNQSTKAEIQRATLGSAGTYNAMISAFGDCRAKNYGDAAAWTEVGMEGMEEKPGPCWGKVDMAGDDAKKFPMAKSLVMEQPEAGSQGAQAPFMSLTISGKSSAGRSCMMNTKFRGWRCSNCCCRHGLVDYDIQFQDLSTGSPSCGLWFMRTANFVRGFIATAVLLPERVNMQQHCPMDLYARKVCDLQDITASQNEAEFAMKQRKQLEQTEDDHNEVNEANNTNSSTGKTEPPSLASLLKGSTGIPLCSPIQCCDDVGCTAREGIAACAGCAGCEVQENSTMTNVAPKMEELAGIESAELCSAMCSLYGGKSWLYNGTGCVISRQANPVYKPSPNMTSGKRCPGAEAAAYAAAAATGQTEMFLAAATQVDNEAFETASSGPQVDCNELEGNWRAYNDGSYYASTMVNQLPIPSGYTDLVDSFGQSIDCVMKNTNQYGSEHWCIFGDKVYYNCLSRGTSGSAAGYTVAPDKNSIQYGVQQLNSYGCQNPDCFRKAQPGETGGSCIPFSMSCALYRL